MKITICGKGGRGKSTVAALLSKEFARMGKTVLVVDSDESNFGLHRQLGVELPRDFTEYFGSKDKAFNRVDGQNLTPKRKLACNSGKILAVLPSDPEISEAGLLGREPTMENTPIQHLAAALLNENPYGGR